MIRVLKTQIRAEISYSSIQNSASLSLSLTTTRGDPPPLRRDWLSPVGDNHRRRPPLPLPTSLSQICTSFSLPTSLSLSQLSSQICTFHIWWERVSNQIGARFCRASEEEAPIRGSWGDPPPLCAIPATKILTQSCQNTMFNIGWEEYMTHISSKKSLI